MEPLAINNRLHRSGAIDYNVSYHIRQSEILKQNEGTDCKDVYELQTNGRSHDVLSVCEGEPLYTVRRSKASRHGSAMSGRNPIEVISSLNGYKDADRRELCKGGLDLMQHSSHKTLSDSWMHSFALCEQFRDLMFANIKPSGVSVTKWEYDRIGKQGDLFVATRGGLNTIYVDDDVEAGDTLVVDLPHNDMWDMQSCSSCDMASPCWGFVQWKPKKGVSRNKLTLVVRSMPSINSACMPGKADRDTLKDYTRKIRQAFSRRGQILGQCVRSAKAGERCDIVLSGNAIGMWTSKDNHTF
jgi:hypothetical protein